MRSILSLFKKSPFGPLKAMVSEITNCVEKVPIIIDAVEKKDWQQVESIAKEISELEHNVDLIKNEIRDNLPASIFLPVNRSDFLNVLVSLDSIADCAEDIGVLLTMRKMDIPEYLKKDLDEFVDVSINTYKKAASIFDELDGVVELSFGGEMAKHIINLTMQVSEEEHKADLIQDRILKNIFNHEDELGAVAILMWLKILQKIGDLANLSEKMVNRFRLWLS